MKKFKKKMPEWLIETPFELAQPFPGKTCIAYDIEVFPNFFMCMVIGPKNIPIVYTLENLDQMISDLSNKNLIMVGFNNLGYDDYIMKYIFMAKTTGLSTNLQSAFQSNKEDFHAQMFSLSGSIINSPNKKPQWYWDLWNYSTPWGFSMDAFCIPEKKMGLKERATQKHAISIQDLPYPFDSKLTEPQKKEVISYCEKDVRNTIVEWNDAQPYVEMRQTLSGMYPNSNILSKPNPGVCEEIMTVEYCQRSGLTKKYIKSQIKKPGKRINIKNCIPQWVEFESPILNSYKNRLISLSGRFSSKADLEVLSETLELKDVTINVGAGGLHSVDKPRIIEPTEDQLLFDLDIQSYYIAIIRTFRLFPEHLSTIILDILENVADLRIKHKKEGDKKISDALKVITLSYFGKTGNEYSILFDELVQLQITIGGQLSFLMFIEQLLKFKIEVISANTDGVLILVDKKKRFIIEKIAKKWQAKTGLLLERTDYKKYIARDVNNYIAVKIDDQTKEKGIFRIENKKKGIKKLKNKAEILQDALRAYFIDGISPADYIMECDDLRKFIFYFHVSHSGGWSMHHRRITSENQIKKVSIQDTSRWYISRGIKETNKGSRPLLDVGDIMKRGKMTQKEQKQYCKTHQTTEHPDNWMKEIHVENGVNSVIINDLLGEFPKDLYKLNYILLVKKRIKEIEDYV